MKLQLGNHLKTLRLEKGLTQEQLAEVFGVSPQAVSRWENDAAYPDLTMLAGIAIYYDTSVDALLGMDTIRKKQTADQIICQVYVLAADGNMTQAISLARESLKLYPSNSGLMMALSETLANHSDDPAVTEEAIAIGERVLQCSDITMKARCTTTLNLMFLYRKLGHTDRANELVRSLPHIWESRELTVPEIYDGAEYAKALKAAVRKALAFLCFKIESVPTRRGTPSYVQLGADLESEKRLEEMLEEIKTFLEQPEN